MVLVLAAPWLARYNLAWVVPPLGGLWWGAAGGAWMGGLAALWGQALAGMAGLNPDWLALIGASPSVAGVAQRFGEADSLDTLKLILEPLAPNATLLLYHLLQVAAWAAVGGIVGFLADRAWFQRRRPWGTMLIGVGGAFALMGAHIGLGVWLERYTRETLSAMWPAIIATTIVVAVVVAVAEGLRDFLEHPLRPRPRRKPAGHARKGNIIPRWRIRLRGDHDGSGREIETERAPLPVPAQLPDWEPVDESEDLIMLELD
jgi:hypothetical protein